MDYTGNVKDGYTDYTGNTVSESGSGGLPPAPTETSVLVYRGTTGNWETYNFDTSGSVYDGDMTITGALTVNTIISDLDIEDAIISLNKNSADDSNTSGFVLLNTNDTKFSGLLKNGNSNDFYLFANSSQMPTETGWTPEQNGNLFAGRVALCTSDNSNACLSVRPADNLEQAILVTKPLGHAADLIRVVDNVSTLFSVSPNGGVTCSSLVAGNEIVTLNMQIGNSGNDYILPTSRATAPGQVITSGVGLTTSWEDIPTPTTLESLTGNATISIVDNVTTFVNDSNTRLTLDPLKTEITSPDLLKKWVLTDTESVYSHNGLNRMEFLNTYSRITSPNTVNQLNLLDNYVSIRGGDNLIVQREWLYLSDAETRIRDGNNQNRLLINATSSALTTNSAGTTSLVLQDAGVSLVRDGNLIAFGSPIFNSFYSPTQGAELELVDNSIKMKMGISTRLEITPTVLQLRDENGDPAVTSVGSTTSISGGSGVGSYQGVIVGTGNVLVKSPNGQYGVELYNDKIQLMSSADERLLINSTGSVLQSPTTVSALELSDTQLIMRRDNSTVLSAVNGATILSNNNGGELRLGEGPAGTRIRRGGVTRLNITGTGTQLLSPGGSDFFVGDNNLNIELQDAGSVIRVRQNFDTTESRFSSPDGTEKLRMTDSDFRIGGNYTIPIVAGTEGQLLEVDGSGNLQYNLTRQFVSLQAEQTTSLVLTAQNTYFTPTNPIASGLQQGFTLSGLTATYDDAYPIWVRVSIHASMERTSTGVAHIFALSLLKNGIKQPGKCRFKCDDAAPYPQEASYETILGISTNDILAVGIANEDAIVSSLNVYSVSFTVNRV